MTSVLRTALAEMRAQPERAAVLLDIDGTLAPIVEHASEAHVPEPTRQLLIAISRRYRVVACVSGRQASQARAMVSIGSITYLGSHGAELLQAGWTEAQLDPRLAEWARRIEAFGRQVNTPELRRRRVRVEEKGPIVAFHWRGAPDEVGARAAVAELATRAEENGFGTHWGRKVLEVRPPVSISKGAGVRSLLDGSGVEVALYAGDDVTDLDAFRAIADMRSQGLLRHAIRAGVRSDEGPSEIVQEADVVLEGTDGVQEMLAMLAEA